MLQKAPIAINDPRMRALLGNANLFSITYRLFKLPGLLEPHPEDYGQVAIYKVSPDPCLPTHMRLVKAQSFCWSICVVSSGSL